MQKLGSVLLHHLGREAVSTILRLLNCSNNHDNDSNSAFPYVKCDIHCVKSLNVLFLCCFWAGEMTLVREE